jgi:antitoxin component YwqK of YwqJK toxin-antitoxin module
MMKNIFCFTLYLVLISCSIEESESKTKIDSQASNNDTIDSIDQMTVDKSELIEIEGNMYSEYYPGKKDLKFQGPQDEMGERHGKWLYFSENGDELSMTLYKNGKRHGHSIVKYPNGGIHYIGEYRENKQVREWKTYTIEGKLHEVKKFEDPDN